MTGAPHHSHPHHGAPRAGRALWIALVILGVLLVFEVVGALVANSLALLSDAAHLLTDVVAVALALLARWFAARPATAHRSYGWRRVEVIAALANGLTLWLVAGGIVVEAVRRLAEPPTVATTPMIVVAAIGFVAQLAASLVLLRASAESINVRGAYIHAATDAIQSLGVVVAGLVIAGTGWLLVDPLISLAIGVMIIWSGGRIVVDATHVLIEGTPPEIPLAKVAAVLRGTPGVARIADLHVWALTTGWNVLTAQIVAEPTLDPAGREALADELTTSLRERFPLRHVTLRVLGHDAPAHHECCGGFDPPGP